MRTSSPISKSSDPGPARSRDWCAPERRGPADQLGTEQGAAAARGGDPRPSPAGLPRSSVAAHRLRRPLCPLTGATCGVLTGLTLILWAFVGLTAARGALSRHGLGRWRQGLEKDQVESRHSGSYGTRGGWSQHRVGLGGHSVGPPHESGVAGGHGTCPGAGSRVLQRLVSRAGVARRQVRGRTEGPPGTGTAIKIGKARRTRDGR